MEQAKISFFSKIFNRVKFDTWKVDFYNYSIDVTYDPGVHFVIIIRFHHRIWSCRMSGIGGIGKKQQKEQ